LVSVVLATFGVRATPRARSTAIVGAVDEEVDSALEGMVSGLQRGTGRLGVNWMWTMCQARASQLNGMGWPSLFEGADEAGVGGGIVRGRILDLLWWIIKESSVSE
jgi:hypothetical protein